MSDIPKSWNSLESLPALRRPTDEEWRSARLATFKPDALTPFLLNNLAAIYAKAVGEESKAAVNSAIRRAGCWDYDTHKPLLNTDCVIDLEFGNRYERRLGGRDWHSTKFVISEDDRNPSLLCAHIDPNTPLDDTVGYAERDIRSIVYFGEMAAGFLDLSGLRVDTEPARR